MELKGSKTEANLWAAFAGESQARNKYTYYASAAKKEGYEQIAAIFLDTAENEKEHAKLWYKALGAIGNTAENLRSAAEGEHFEFADMYPEFAKVAREEGFQGLATLFDRVGQVEAEHEKRYLALLENVTKNKVFAKDEPVYWHCRNCGHIHQGATAPTTCPTCAHPQAFFEVWAANY